MVVESAQGVFRQDARGVFVQVDARAAGMLGYSADELTGLHYSVLHFEDGLTRAQHNFAQRLAGSAGTIEYRLRRKDGTPVWVAVSSVPHVDAAGNCIGVTGFLSDIDQRRRLENLAGQERRLLRLIAGHCPLSAVMEDLCMTLADVSRHPLQVAVMLVDGQNLTCLAAPGLPPRYRAEHATLPLATSGMACAEAVRSGRVVVANTAGPDAAPETAALRRDYGVGAVWAYPVVQGGETLGALVLLPRVAGEPDAEDERTIRFALEVARLALAHERKAEALRLSEQRFRDYAELSADWYWEQDAEFRFTYMSGGVCNKGGFRVADSLGKTRWELPIEGVDAAQWAAHRALLERQEVFRDFTYVIRVPGGSPRWFSVSGKPVFGAGGRFQGYRGIGRDVTERVIAQNILERTRHWLEQAVKAAGIGLWERDVESWDFQFTSNWKALFGYAEGEIGNSAADFDRLIHPDDLTRVHAAARAYAANPQGEYQNRFRIRHKDGAWRWVLSRGNLLDDPVSKRRTWMGCHLDITEQIQAEQRISELAATLEARVRARTAALEEANRELDAFNFSVSHDLRTPLRAIEGFSQALLEDCHGRLDATGHDHLRRIVAATARMGELIEALYDLSVLSRAPLYLRPVRLSDMARELVAELCEREPGRTMEADIAETPAAEGDARLLRLMLANLLGNAWKYTSRTARGRIAFGARTDERGRCIYFVRDNGAGFDMRFADKLFRMFHRLHREEEFGGQGVGLTTAHRVVARHGGRIWAEAAPGSGATFFFTLWDEADLRSEMLQPADDGWAPLEA
ncbi:MAG: PAS domain S-box protein [Denitratisoma sp.]|nr:PAS domain S-box protein [Denitratisoma sp.]